MSEHRDLGRQQAERLRAEAGLPTPVDDPMVLRRLADILDREPAVPTAQRPSRTTPAMRRRGAKAGDHASATGS